MYKEIWIEQLFDRVSYKRCKCTNIKKFGEPFWRYVRKIMGDEESFYRRLFRRIFCFERWTVIMKVKNL